MNAYPRSNYRTKPFPQRGIMIILPAGETLDFPTRHSKNASTWRHHLYRPLAKVRARARRPPSTSKTDRHLSSLGSHFQHPKPHQPQKKKRAHGRERKKTAAPAAEAASRHPYAHGPAAPHGTSWRSVDLRAQSSACIPGILFLSSRGYRTVPQPAAADPHPSGQAWRRVFIVWRGTSRAGWYAYHVLTGWRKEAADPPIHLLTYFRAARAV